MMKDLVVVERGMILTDTQIINRALVVKHAYVMDAMNRMLEDYPDLRVASSDRQFSGQDEYIRFETRSHKGQEFQAAVMNREAYTLLILRFNTKRAREIQRAFNSAFYAMERELLKASENKVDTGWITSRNQSKIVRLSVTDVIKEFTEYATSQGSKSAQFYYKHITNATYAALQLIQHDNPKLRDTLDALELANLMAAEGLASRALRRYMAQGEHYKAIFVLVKQDLERFASSLMLPCLPPKGISN